MKFLSKFFKRTKSTIKNKLSKASVGDAVRIKFIHPRKMGYVDEGQSFSRFDPVDYPDRIVIGQITRIRTDIAMDVFVLDVSSIKVNGFRRNYIFFENEIEEFDYLTKEK